MGARSVQVDVSLFLQASKQANKKEEIQHCSLVAI